MTYLRQNRWLALPDLWRTRPVLLSTHLLLGAGLLLAAPAFAAPHAHARRPLPTALHSASVSEGTPRTGSRHKPAGKASTRSHAASAGAAAHQPAARGKKRGRKPEPADDPIPMFRAGRGKVPLEHHANRESHVAAARGHHELLADVPVSHGRGGRQHSKAPSMAWTPPVERAREPWGGRSSPASAAGVRTPSHLPPSVAREEGMRDGRYVASHAAVASSDAAPRPFAEGVSHPDGDERLPVSRALAASEDIPDAAVAAPVVRVSAAPAGSGNQPGVQVPVVQGFGSEMAVPSGVGAERPGGTHRRNHPSNWVPQSFALPAEPLEEQEAVTAAAVSPTVLPLLYDRNGRLVVPAPLKGSHEVLVHQNTMATSDGLIRIQDDADLDRLRAAHLLVSFPATDGLRVSEDLPLNRRCARPWTVLFALDAGHAFYARFHQPLQVNSAVRTVAYQARLQMVNGNAAAIAGDAASPHLTGQAIDIGKRGMSVAQLAWMRGYLLPLMRAGKIDVEEEFQQACFHISVYRSYAPVVHRPVHEIAQGVSLPGANPEGSEAAMQ